MVNGVAQVNVFGSQKYAVRIGLDPRKLANLKIGLDEVEQSLGAWNVNLPTGGLEGKNQAFTIQVSGQLYNAKAFQDVVIAYREAGPGTLARRSLRSRTASRTTRLRPGSTPKKKTARGHHSGHTSGSPAPTPSRWSTTSNSCSPSCTGSCPVGSASI